MADHTKPTEDSIYVPDFLTELHGRIDDSVTLDEAPTNPPIGYIRWNRTSDKLEEWDGAAWVTQLVSIAGGGTGAANAADARTNLGIGSLGTQAANAVAITGGTIAGITSLSLSGNLAFNINDTHDIGSNAIRLRKIYAASAVVLPVGADKYATS